jgi:SnoaL-like domain
MTLDPLLQELIDHHQIRKTLAEYCHACDRGDEAMMAECYTGEDSWDDHGLVKASGPEYVKIMIGRVLQRTEALDSAVDDRGSQFVCRRAFDFGHEAAQREAGPPAYRD